MATAHPKRDIDPATPFHQLPGDLLLNTARRLGELGFDAQLAEVVRQSVSEARVRQHLIGLRESLQPELRLAEVRRETRGVDRQRSHLIHRLYASSDLQLAHVRKWNKRRHWGIPEDWFTNLGPAPAWPEEELSCVTLEVALPDQPETRDKDGNTFPGIPGYIRTVREIWDIISHQHPSAGKYSEFHLDAEHLELLEGATYEPGLRWRVLDLGANWDRTNNIRPVDVRNPQTSPNVDGFAALAHHPCFVRSMNGTTIPFLWIAGFMISVPGNDPRMGVPGVSFNRRDRSVGLSACSGLFWEEDRAVPVRRESKRAA